MFGDLDVSIYFDDLIIAGKDQHDHDGKLKKLLQKAQEFNVKFNREKIQYNRSEVNNLGHIVSKNGQKPDKWETLRKCLTQLMEKGYSGL